MTKQPQKSPEINSYNPPELRLFDNNPVFTMFFPYSDYINSPQLTFIYQYVEIGACRAIDQQLTSERAKTGKLAGARI